MAMARILLLLIGVLAVLTLGVSAPARAEAVAPPCHEMAAGRQGGSDPGAPTPGKAPVMACCAACVATSTPVLPEVPAPIAVPDGETFAPAPSLLVGLSPAPELGPPRL